MSAFKGRIVIIWITLCFLSNVPLICISHIFFCMILCKLTNRVCQLQYSALTYVDQCFRNIFFSIHDDYSVAFVSLFNNDMTVVFFNEVNTALPVQLDYPDIVLLAQMVILVQFYHCNFQVLHKPDRVCSQSKLWWDEIYYFLRYQKRTCI